MTSSPQPPNPPQLDQLPEDFIENEILNRIHITLSLHLMRYLSKLKFTGQYKKPPAKDTSPCQKIPHNPLAHRTDDVKALQKFIFTNIKKKFHIQPPHSPEIFQYFIDGFLQKDSLEILSLEVFNKKSLTLPKRRHFGKKSPYRNPDVIYDEDGDVELDFEARNAKALLCSKTMSEMKSLIDLEIVVGFLKHGSYIETFGIKDQLPSYFDAIKEIDSETAIDNNDINLDNIEPTNNTNDNNADNDEASGFHTAVLRLEALDKFRIVTHYNGDFSHHAIEPTITFLTTQLYMPNVTHMSLPRELFLTPVNRDRMYKWVKSLPKLTTFDIFNLRTISVDDTLPFFRSIFNSPLLPYISSFVFSPGSDKLHPDVFFDLVEEFANSPYLSKNYSKNYKGSSCFDLDNNSHNNTSPSNNGDLTGITSHNTSANNNDLTKPFPKNNTSTDNYNNNDDQTAPILNNFKDIIIYFPPPPSYTLDVYPDLLSTEQYRNTPENYSNDVHFNNRCDDFIDKLTQCTPLLNGIQKILINSSQFISPNTARLDRTLLINALCTSLYLCNLREIDDCDTLEQIMLVTGSKNMRNLKKIEISFQSQVNSHEDDETKYQRALVSKAQLNDALISIPKSPYLTNLERFVVTDDKLLGDEFFEGWARSSSLSKISTDIVLESPFITSNVFNSLSIAGNFNNIKGLAIDGNASRQLDFHSPEFISFLINTHNSFPSLEKLHFSNLIFSSQSFRALINSPLLLNLKTLKLANVHIMEDKDGNYNPTGIYGNDTTDMLSLLVTSPMFEAKKLTRFSLSHGYGIVGQSSFYTLSKSPYMSNLEHLFLEEMKQIGDDDIIWLTMGQSEANMKRNKHSDTLNSFPCTLRKLQTLALQGMIGLTSVTIDHFLKMDPNILMGFGQIFFPGQLKEHIDALRKLPWCRASTNAYSQ